MRSRYLNGVFAIFTAILMIAFGPAGISAQGKGHGGGGNKGGGGGQPGRGNQGPPQTRAPQPRMEMPRPQPQARIQQPRVQQQVQQPRMQERRIQQPRVQQMPQIQQQQRGQQRRQQVFTGPPAGVQRPEVNARRQEQVWQDRGRVRAEQQRQEMGRRQEQFRVEQQNRPDRQTRVERGNDNGIFRQERRADNVQRGQGPPAWSNAWPNNHGFDRSSEVHERNALRQSFRNDQQALRSDNRVTRWFTNQYADLPEYRQNRRAFEDHERWRESFLRNIVVSARLSNSGYSNFDP
ncbi:MAG TPA: hypothetical protein VHQ01_13105, partial [Pyrinomonadaceae bacterium]|nr:hypothetical protein [Pyrinomonadaceae bacterium]